MKWYTNINYHNENPFVCLCSLSRNLYLTDIEKELQLLRVSEKHI